MSVLLFVLLWLLITVPLALLVGKCFYAGNAAGDERPLVQPEQTATQPEPIGNRRSPGTITATASYSAGTAPS
jgi:hypothetical protein